MAYYGDERDNYNSERNAKLKKDNPFVALPPSVNKHKMEGFGKKETLHAIIIKKGVDKSRADEIAKHLLKNVKKVPFMRETKMSYRYRVVPKTKFEPKSFRTKIINKNMSLVFGCLKDDNMHMKGSGLLDWFSNAWEDVKKGATDLWDGVKKTATDVYDGAKGIFDNLTGRNATLPEPEEDDEPEEEEKEEDDEALHEIELPDTIDDMKLKTDLQKNKVNVNPKINKKKYKHLPKNYFDSFRIHKLF